MTLYSVSVTLPFVETYRTDAWTALGDPVRRAILERLAERPRVVGELAGDLPVSRPAVSQHLKVLKGARLVTDRKDGTRRVYQVDFEGLGEMRNDLDRFWIETLGGFKTTIEQQLKRRKP